MPAMKISRAQLDKIQNRFKSLQGRIARAKEQAETVAKTVVQTTEIGGTALVFGLANGYWVDEATGERGINVLGMPLELITAIGLHGIAFFGGESRWSTDMHNVGDGALAAWSTLMGIQLGEKMRQERAGATEATSEVTSGRRRMTTGRSNWARGLSDAQIRQMARY